MLTKREIAELRQLSRRNPRLARKISSVIRRGGFSLEDTFQATLKSTKSMEKLVNDMFTTSESELKELIKRRKNLKSWKNDVNQSLNDLQETLEKIDYYDPDYVFDLAESVEMYSQSYVYEIEKIIKKKGLEDEPWVEKSLNNIEKITYRIEDHAREIKKLAQKAMKETRTYLGY